MKYILTLFAFLLVAPVSHADEFGDLLVKFERNTAEMKRKAPATPTKEADNCCKCPNCICGDDCQCQYPGQCLDEAKWFPSQFPNDPGYFLFVGTKLVGGLYPSGTYIPYCHDKWGQPCNCPVAKPKAGTRCGPNGCKVGYFGDGNSGGCSSGDCSMGGCDSCGACGQSASSDCAACGASGASAEAGAGRRHPVRNLIHRLFHGRGRGGRGGCSSCQ